MPARDWEGPGAEVTELAKGTPSTSAAETANGIAISNADSSRMGKAVEHLVASTCIILSRGQLNVSTSLVDDEGVDVVFHRRGGSATIAVQIKARMNDSRTVQQHGFHAQVRSQTLRPRDDLYILFVLVDVATGTFDTCWLVPSQDFVSMARRDAKARHVFVASAKPASRDQWSRYRLTRNELAVQMEVLLDREASADEGAPDVSP